MHQFIQLKQAAEPEYVCVSVVYIPPHAVAVAPATVVAETGAVVVTGGTAVGGMTTNMGIDGSSN